MKTIEDYDLDFSAANDATMFGMTSRQCTRVLKDQRNAAVAERDEAMNLLREIVKYVDESDSWETLPRDVQHKARELLNRKEGQ